MKPSSRLGTTPYLTPEVYARWRASELGVLTESLEDRLLFSLIGDPAGQKVLDIGCGDGAFTLALAERGAHVVGIDASEAMIAAAAQRLVLSGVDARLCVGITEQLPFVPDAYDLVFAKTVLCFVEDASGVFAEIARVLRPGGRLVIGELGKYSQWAMRRYIKGRLGSPLWRRGHFRTAAQLRKCAEDAGLTVESIRGAVYYPRSLHLARLMSRIDDKLADVTTVGAAFLAMAASKPR